MPKCAIVKLCLCCRFTNDPSSASAQQQNECVLEIAILELLTFPHNAHLALQVMGQSVA